MFGRFGREDREAINQMYANLSSKSREDMAEWVMHIRSCEHCTKAAKEIDPPDLRPSEIKKGGEKTFNEVTRPFIHMWVDLMCVTGREISTKIFEFYLEDKLENKDEG